MKYNCVIAEDEPIARDIIQAYCNQLPYLEVVATCANALEAKMVLQNQKVDILFLDINMPVMDGITFLKTLKTQPQVILTTAYKEYAIDAFDLSVIDYLLKPFSLDRFMIAVDKAVERLQSSAQQISTSTMIPDEKTTEDFFFVKTDRKIFKIRFDELLYAEAAGNFTKFVMQSQVLSPSMTFSNAEEHLPGHIFLRVHRSFIINKTRISHIEGNRVFIADKEIPIGSNYKEAFLREIGLDL
ncbi:LytTR family DNA-binding domain-containing protein [Terrimonas sp. NA20]|uniref:LytTR family DNA-binding domain-containing protein n=1 Tax=Terrimonas ginsenosidimutans TaxID=2908004 RepID=A0ABS9KVL7_9BACT|nr:LytTR family DNA-binding domain-containing protein [Terrimonas ginsenosidimutans]MCG2616392.1 LytTR family DNA-binding domain-containing protein [Terrimonas ginsenosidimutans]